MFKWKVASILEENPNYDNSAPDIINQHLRDL